MRRSLLGLAMAAWTATASAQTAAPAPAGRDLTPIVVGAGAIAGVLVFNVFALGWAAVPGAVGYAAGASVPAEMSVAMSRLYAVSSAVAGGLLADYAYYRR